VTTHLTAAQLAAAVGTPFEPTPQQWASISAPLQPAVVIAGAGSGKTTLMAMRVVYLVLTGQVHPDQVLGLTFTTKAAAQLRDRIHSALSRAGVLDAVAGGEVLGPTVSTYNAYAANLLTEHGLRIGHEPTTRVITDAAGFQLAQRVIWRSPAMVNGGARVLSDHPETVIADLLKLEGMLNEHLVTVAEVLARDAQERASFERALEEERAGKARKTYLDPIASALVTIDRRAELLGLVEEYRRHKQRLGLMDFGDQIARSAALVSQYGDVGAREREKFPVVLLDEYQDTSVAQAKLLSALFSGADPSDQAGSGRGHAVMAVGDPNQAIYGWRGASVSNILRFGEAFPSQSQQALSFSLSVNQRSDTRILEAANELAKPLLQVSPEVPKLDPAPGRPVGTIRVNVLESLDQELDWVADQIQAAHSGLWSDIGVLVRDNQTAAQAFDKLTSRGIPVEIVGLSGLLRLPEIAELVAILRLLHDVTANAAVLTLLTGPRWAIGPRDLQLLSRRARELSGSAPGVDPANPQQQLERIADGLDPTEIPALTDALDDPGDGPFSAAARERFEKLSSQLRRLRSMAAEPVLDVVRRIIDLTGVDVELASSNNPAAAARRDNLDLFLKAVADFRGLDGEVTLPALLAYLTAEDEIGKGLELATPTEADSVKLLTVHRAKGLEWESVFMVGVCQTKFPATNPRPTWVSSAAVLPTTLRGDAKDLPDLQGHDKAALDDYRARVRKHEETEELRLAYVAVTRAERQLVVTSHLWDPKNKTPRGPSSYQQQLKDLLQAWEQPIDGWQERPDPKVTPNPLAGGPPEHFWPVPGRSSEASARAEVAALIERVGPGGDDLGLNPAEAALVDDWDQEIDRLVGEARALDGDVVEVSLPRSLSVTGWARLQSDPSGFQAELIRPMPRRPSAAARFGTSFHEWVAHRFQQRDLFDPIEFLDPSDADLVGQDELAELIAAFESGPYADRIPLAVEAPFSLVLDGMVVKGRIDAVYSEPQQPDRFELVDWKTGSEKSVDRLQLALYRLAWAELAGVDPEQVDACFHFPITGRTVAADQLPGRSELVQLLRSVGS